MTESAAVENQKALVPLALVEGNAASLPDDLYIPPDALRVFLESFEGPLDLLLYLIRKQNLDITGVSVSKVTAQYLDYISLMGHLRFELAAEYLVMAALLAEIKSRALLPRHEEIQDEDDDVAADLVRRLQEYERYKQAADDIDELPRLERDIFTTQVEYDKSDGAPLPETTLDAVIRCFAEALKRAELQSNHQIQFEPLSVRERMSELLDLMSNAHDFVELKSFFKVEDGKMGIVVSFLAVLELTKECLIELTQNEVYGPIYIRGAQCI